MARPYVTPSSSFNTSTKCGQKNLLYSSPIATIGHKPDFGVGDYIDKKIGVNGKTIWRVREEDLKVEFMETMKILEAELGDKPFFGGDKFGFVEVALVPYSSWFYTFGKIANLSIETKCPKISVWAKRCLEKESVSKTLPDPGKVYSFVLMVKQRLGFE